MIKKIWKDPVGSKVIAVGIIGIISLVYAKVKSVTSDISFIEALKGIYDLKVRIVYIAVIIVLYLLLKIIIKKFFNKEGKGYYTKEQEELRKFNKMIDTSQGLKVTWGVYFDYHTPFISDLTLFCTKHDGPPLRFMNNRCPIPNCKNAKNGIDYYAVKNLIESDLIEKWEKIKNGS